MRKPTYIPWEKEFWEIHEKYRKINPETPDMNVVKELQERLEKIEPQIEAFEPEEEDWGAINSKHSAINNMGFMKCFFKLCKD